MRHKEGHFGHRIGWLRAMVLGANDGIISTASLLLGVAAADSTRSAILTAGMAGLVAGAISMALGEYVSVSSQRDTESAAVAKELRELAASVKEAEARLPDEREIADLLSSVAGSARAVGLDITLFRQKPETYSNFYANVPVEMTMRGTYHELAQFLDRVRQMFHLWHVIHRPFSISFACLIVIHIGVVIGLGYF